MIVLKITAIALVCAVLCLLLKKDQPAYSFLIASAGVFLLVSVCIAQLRPVILWVKTLAAYTQGGNLSVVLHVLAIGIFSQLAEELCKDAGVSAAAYAVGLCGRALALIEVIPLAQSLLSSFMSSLS